jgi:hypothetical protein
MRWLPLRRSLGMRPVLWALGLAVLLHSHACRQGEAMSAVEHNDLIVMELDQASRRMADYYVSSSRDAGPLDALASYMGTASDRLRQLPPYKGDDRLLDASLELLDFYKRLCQEQNRSLLDLTVEGYYTATDSLQVQRLLAAIIVEENRQNTRFLAMQDSFASQHGILLVEALE